MKMPTVITLTYPNDAEINRIADHLITLSKSMNAPRIEIEENDEDEYNVALRTRLTQQGVPFNRELSDEDKPRYTDDYDIDPTVPDATVLNAGPHN